MTVFLDSIKELPTKADVKDLSAQTEKGFANLQGKVHIVHLYFFILNLRLCCLDSSFMFPSTGVTF